jgi:hypothetical protein
LPTTFSIVETTQQQTETVPEKSTTESLVRFNETSKEQESTTPLSTTAEGTSESQQSTTLELDFTTGTENVPTRALNTLPPPPSFRPASPSETSRQTTSPTTTVPLPANRCAHPVDPGNCAGKFNRWFWNDQKRICEQFTYTGYVVYSIYV